VKNCRIKGSVKSGKQRKTEDWYFSLPWPYALLKLGLRSLIMPYFLQTFKTVKLTFSLTV
jgi:hypothetical protein